MARCAEMAMMSTTAMHLSVFITNKHLLQSRQIGFLGKPQFFNAVHMPIVVQQHMPGENVEGILIIFRMGRHPLPDPGIGIFKEHQLLFSILSKLQKGCIRAQRCRSNGLITIFGRVERDNLRMLLLHKALKTPKQHRLDFSQVADMFRYRPETIATPQV